jgi:pyrroline-5-carboxylate reductase
VLDHSDVVILAVRPQIAAAVLTELKFEPRHHVINLIATFSRDQMTALVMPASNVTCAVPLPSVALGLSPTAIYPHDPLVFALFKSLGVAVQVETQSEFRALQSASAAMAAHFTTLDALSEWLGGRGVDAKTAHDYVEMMSFGLGQVMHSSGLSFLELAAEFKTKGGLNEQFAEHLTTNGVFEAYFTGLDAILARIDRGAALHPAPQEPGATAG